jgi:cation-transporting P-type ATPase E
LTSVRLGLANVVISAVQEIRARRKLDRLQLLDRMTVLVVRDGGWSRWHRTRSWPLLAAPLPSGERVEADESLLTGESVQGPWLCGVS